MYSHQPTTTPPSARLSRRELFRNAAWSLAAVAFTGTLTGCVRRRDILAGAPSGSADGDLPRLEAWTRVLRAEQLDDRDTPFGRSAVRVGELAVGTPYEAFALEAYLRAGGSPQAEPLVLSLARFDCVSLVESCLALSRTADDPGPPSWERFGREIERMRYRGGRRSGYTSRLHYFSEWISDGERRGLLRNVGATLGGVADGRPLRFMTEHRSSYPGLADDAVFRDIAAMERSLDASPRLVVPSDRIADVADQIESGDVLGFATAVSGLDVTHSAFAYRGSDGVLRVLHAPLAGGAVEITATTLPQYVTAIRRSTGILVARPLRA